MKRSIKSKEVYINTEHIRENISEIREILTKIKQGEKADIDRALKLCDGVLYVCKLLDIWNTSGKNGWE